MDPLTKAQQIIAAWTPNKGKLFSEQMTLEEAKVQKEALKVLNIKIEREFGTDKVRLVVPRSALREAGAQPVPLMDITQVLNTARQERPYAAKLQQFTETAKREMDPSVRLAERFDKLEELTPKVAYFSKEEVYGRFGDILSPRETAVLVEPFKENLDPNEKVTGLPLHANHVHLGGQHTICAQAPPVKDVNYYNAKEGTEHIEIAKFWQAVSQNSNLILDLTNPADAQKGVTPYFPEQVGLEVTYKTPIPFQAHLKIKCVEQKVSSSNPNIRTSLYEVTDLLKNPPTTRLFHRVHHNAWPDHGAVELKELKSILDHFEKAQKKYAQVLPAVVHCRAGVGRTGTTVVALAMTELIKRGEITQENYREYIDGLILTGREQRGKLFVQTEFQYHSLIELAENLLQIKKPKTPEDEILEKVTTIADLPGTHGDKTRGEAEALLKDKPNRSWLIRTGSDGRPVLSMKKGTQFTHAIVQERGKALQTLLKNRDLSKMVTT